MKEDVLVRGSARPWVARGPLHLRALERFSPT